MAGLRCSAATVGIEETVEWFWWECNLRPYGSFSLDKRFVYGKESILVRLKFKVIFAVLFYSTNRKDSQIIQGAQYFSIFLLIAVILMQS